MDEKPSSLDGQTASVDRSRSGTCSRSTLPTNDVVVRCKGDRRCEVILEPSSCRWYCGDDVSEGACCCASSVAVWPALGRQFLALKARNKTEELHFRRGIGDLCSQCEFDFPPSWNLCQPDLKTMHLSHSLVTEDPDLRPLPREMAKTYHPQSM